MAEKIIYASADECPAWLSVLVFDTTDSDDTDTNAETTDKESK